MDELMARLDATRDGLAESRAFVVARTPWPLALVFDESDEAHWGPPEVLAHVAEMSSFWLGEMERVLDGPTDPVWFGRVAPDRLRLEIIQRDRSVPPRELYDRIASTYERLDRRLRSLSPAELARVGHHDAYGDLAIPAIVDRFLVTHLADHVAQLRSLIDTR